MTEVLVEGCKGCMSFTGDKAPQLFFSETGGVICATGANARNKAPRIHSTTQAGTLVCNHQDCSSRVAGTTVPDRAVRVRGA